MTVLMGFTEECVAECGIHAEDPLRHLAAASQRFGFGFGFGYGFVFVFLFVSHSFFLQPFSDLSGLRHPL